MSKLTNSKFNISKPVLQRGATFLEVAVTLALVSVVAIPAVYQFGFQTGQTFCNVVAEDSEVIFDPHNQVYPCNPDSGGINPSTPHGNPHWVPNPGFGGPEGGSGGDGWG